MFKRATLIAAAATGVAGVLAGVAGAGDGGPGHEIKVNGLRCNFDKGADIDTHATIAALSVFNSSGELIPAGATVDVSFGPHQGVIPLKASIVSHGDTATGNLIGLTNPFSVVGRFSKHVKCTASAHWVVHMPLRTR